MATSPAPRPNWLTRLKNLPRRWWITFFAISLVVHVIGVGTVLVLLFGGERGGEGAAANYARRSPWPMINILRTNQVRSAQKGIPT
ncbi:MAG: DUF1415 family protein, partial [Pseudomonadota bacterium]|nr:DUF1415 family protein [Pseudomonadota bacterium]